MSPAPGVVVSTSVLSGPAAATDAEEATYFVAGITERGPVGVSTLVRSMAEFGEVYGDETPSSTLHRDLTTYFAEGGGRAAVTRVVGPAATTGELALSASLKAVATSPGSWSSRVSVGVEAGSTADTFTLAVYLDGGIEERWQDVASPEAAVGVLARSAYVRGVDLGGGTDPAVAAPKPLSAGVDDRAAVTGAALVAALPTQDTIAAPNGGSVPAGAGVVAVPGQSATTIGLALAQYAQRTNRVALLSLPNGTSAADAIAAGKTQRATLTQAGVGEFAGLFWPHLLIPVEATGTTRTVGPEGFVAAARTRAILDAGGPWRPGAGQLSRARYAVGVTQTVPESTRDQLDAANVSVIRPVRGDATVYGYRSLSTDVANWALLKDRDVVNAVAVACGRVAEAFTFEVIDGGGRLLADLQAALVGVVDPIAQADGLYPAADGSDPGYRVDTSSAVNTEASLARGEVRAAIGVRPSPAAALVILTIAKAAPTTGL